MVDKAKASSGVISVDFTGVESGGGRPHIPEGDYGLKIASCKLKKGKDSGKPYLNFGFKVIKGNSKGLNKVVQHRCSLTKDSLWNLRNVLEACGMTVPSKAVKLPLEKLIGKECAGTAIDEEYEGKKHSVLSAFFPMTDLVIDDEEPQPKKKGKKDEEEPAEEAEESAEEEAEESSEESAEAAEDEEELFS